MMDFMTRAFNSVIGYGVWGKVKRHMVFVEYI